jgi:hypothetical protein
MAAAAAEEREISECWEEQVEEREKSFKEKKKRGAQPRYKRGQQDKKFSRRDGGECTGM